MTCPRCQHENEAGAKYCSECGAPLKNTSESGPPAASYAELQHALSEALEQQTATSEILRVIGSAHTDAQPVFDAIARSAVRLCNAANAAVFRTDGRMLYHPANYGSSPEALATARARYPRPLDMESAPGIAILTRSVVQVPDIEDPSAIEFVRQVGRLLGFRSVVTVPMLRQGEAVGAIVVARREPGRFSDAEVELLKTFADQAGIAIENMRLFAELQARNRELTEALEQQTATSEILRVISRSPTDVQPVFDALAANAARLCSAPDVFILRIDKDVLRMGAGVGPLSASAPADFAFPLTRGSVSGRAIIERRTLHIRDLAAEPEDEFPVGKDLQRRFGHRTLLATPLLREDVALGVICVFRTEVRPFMDSQIDLLKTFADQAVIAIENVRLFTELEARNREVTEALEQRTATAEILRAISSSPTDFQPVFDTIVRNAARVCEAFDAVLVLSDGDEFVQRAHHGPIAAVLDARYPLRGTVGGRAVLEARVIHVENLAEASDYPAGRELAQRIGYRTTLSVPLLRDGAAIGAITIRRTEVHPFSDKQIALLQTFADQAVIAIENVRLFTELQEKNRALTQAHAQVTESLEQQTATSEILRVISSSPTNVQPVFDTILANALRLCEAHNGGIFTFDGQAFRMAAAAELSDDFLAYLRGAAILPGPETPLRRVGLEPRASHVADILADPSFSPPEVYRREGMRTSLAVPMLREGRLVGALAFHRRNVRPFTEKQIALLETFADQAVIAIENVRLFKELDARNRELTESLEQQTATAEILRAISSSPTDLQPVMDAVVASASRLAAADHAMIGRAEGGVVRWLAVNGPLVNIQGTPISRDLPSGRAILDCETTQVEDIATLADEFPPVARAYRDLGVRTILATPLVREGAAIGVLLLRRREVRAFTDKQIALVKTFADQAVIAIENVRLFQELQEKNRALTEAHAQVTQALEQQTATSEILRVISASPTDVQPIFDAMCRSAIRLCDAVFSTVVEVSGEWLRLRASHGFHGAELDAIQSAYPMRLHTAAPSAQAIRDRAVLHVPDTETSPYVTFARERGFRSVVAVPVFREGESIAAIAVGRAVPGAFSDRQIALLQTFADQAVIAIENFRLFTELQARTAALTRSVDELTALGEVSRAVGSTLDLETVLKTVVTRANQLARTDGCSIYEYDETAEEFQLRASHYADEREAAVLDPIGRATPIPKGQGMAGRAVLRREPVQIPDITVEGTYESPVRMPLLQAGYRALLAVPLFRDEQIIGILGVSRKTPGEFAPEIIRLLTTFASQSALAIQNARLFREIEEKSRQLEIASRHKSDFLASVSHELRTPMNAILGFNEMILGGVYGDVPQDLKVPLADIQGSGKHLLRLINNVLDLSKIEAGRMELALSDYSVHDMVEAVRSSLRPLAAEKGLDFVTAVSEDIPLACGDAGRLSQCLMNLAGNALKFTRQGRVEIAVELSGDTLYYRVTDTGIGIASDQLQAVFNEFRQADPTISREFGGTGLGLSITKKFIEMHGGRIWVESEPGKGSTFWFTMPLRFKLTKTV